MFNPKIVLTACLLLGFIFTVFGLNGFLQFISQPPMPEAAGQFFGALAGAGYILPLVFGVQFVAGVLLLAGRFVPLALVLLAPIIVNIIGFHLALEPAGIAPGALAATLEVFLLVAYLPYYKPLLTANADPRADRAPGGEQIRTAGR